LNTARGSKLSWYECATCQGRVAGSNPAPASILISNPFSIARHATTTSHERKMAQVAVVAKPAANSLLTIGLARILTMGRKVPYCGRDSRNCSTLEDAYGNGVKREGVAKKEDDPHRLSTLLGDRRTSRWLGQTPSCQAAAPQRGASNRTGIDASSGTHGRGRSGLERLVFPG